MRRVHSDSLYRNSIYLMVSTLIMAILGFFFWMVNTRLFKPEDIGLATTLISVMSLITSFSMFGFNSALVRFLPKTENKSSFINTAFTFITIGTVIITIIFILGLPIFSPQIAFILSSPIFVLSFIIFMIIASLNTVADSVFVAFRNTKYVLIKNTIISIVKLILPVFLVGLGAYGIFYAVVVSVNLAMVLSLIFIAVLFKIYFVPVIAFGVVKKVWRFSFGNYLAGFFGMAPSLIMPILVTNHLGPKFTAYFYMPSMIITLLLTIPRATTTSLFAEGSHDEKSIKVHAIKSFKIIASILVPAVIIIFLFGRYILLVFGKEYSSEGIVYLQLVSLSILISIPTYIFGTVLNVKRHVKKIVILNFIGCISLLGLSYLLLGRGLAGLGFAAILNQIIMVIIFFLLCRKLFR